MNKQQNSFQYLTGGECFAMTVLNAVMSDFSYANHAHEELSLGVTLQGVQEFACQGSRFLSRPGDIILFNPGDVHNGNPGTIDPLKYVMLYLDMADLRPLMQSVAQHHTSQFRLPENHFHDPALRSVILEMAWLTKQNTHSSFLYEHCLQRIAERLARRIGSFSPEAWKQQKDALLLRARDYILDNVATDITIEELTRVAHMSKFHFIRLFRGQFGLTPHQFILNQKINRAKEELATGAPPSLVAQKFGFYDASHLNRCFKRIFGLTPKQYQAQTGRP